MTDCQGLCFPWGSGGNRLGGVRRLGSLSCRATRASLVSCTETRCTYLDLPGQALLTHPSALPSCCLWNTYSLFTLFLGRRHFFNPTINSVC